MITSLSIKNFGLIDTLDLELGRGLSVLTGETGAGKSILIDALRFGLGERLNAANVRDTGKACVVEIVMDLTKTGIASSPMVKEYISDDAQLIISRGYYPDGKNRIKINGFNVTVAQLKELGDTLVDIHGPHDHQLLFSEASHLGILDDLCSFGTLKDVFAVSFLEYSGLLQKREELLAAASNRELEVEMLTHQISELEKVKLDQQAYDDTMGEHNRVSNSEKLFEYVSQLLDILENEETGLSPALSRAFGPSKTLVSLDQTAEGFLSELSGMQDSAETLINRLKDYRDSLSFQPEEADRIKKAYDNYYSILKKYGPDISSALSFYEKARARYELLSDFEHNDSELSGKIEKLKTALLKTAAQITEKRKAAARTLKTTIEKELKELGINNVKFECRITGTDLTKDGADSVCFYISPNLGEELKPLSAIASSGEAARVMLGLKKALIKVDPVPVLIFDEIDAQIGGRLGDITGKKLKELSSGRQVILITHLPQIASFADAHFKVTKSIKGNRTVTEVSSLEKPDRIKELAKMMSGEKESSIALKHAEELLSKIKH